ncbi:hypothetical protein FRC02_001476 [Tulasnella sp. 418]|nr:hypothetical protein FRC02_001476 [Tulasnella sp. 418]
MTNTFKLVRWCAFAWCVVCAAVVLGITAHQATLFLPIAYHRPYIIFALVVSCLTILLFVLLSLRSQPRIDIVVITILCILWLALASYTADRVGHIDCENLAGQTKPTKSGGTTSSVAWCREMKTIMAFSFFTFGFLLIAIIILIALAAQAHSRGYMDAWNGSVSNLGWFGEYPGPGHHDHPMVYPGVTGQSVPYPGNVVYQQPGHDVVIENGHVRQVPTGVHY